MHKENAILIVGWGSQAKAWGLNLTDSKRELFIGLRPNSASFKAVEKMGLKALELGPKLEQFETLVLLIPDHEHLNFLECYQQFFRPGCRLVYAHGASIIQENLEEKFSQFRHLLLAPKAIASELRFRYETKDKLGACYYAALPRDQTFLKELAKGLGISEGLFPASFQEESYADLFSEQSLLCSILPYSALYSFNELRERGISAPVAYMECWLEVKLIANTMIDLGPEKFYELISPNALLGGEKAAKLIFDKEYQKKLKQLSSDIWNGEFFKEVAKADFDQVKEQVIDFWKSTELNKVHQDLKDQLI